MMQSPIRCMSSKGKWVITGQNWIQFYTITPLCDGLLIEVAVEHRSQLMSACFAQTLPLFVVNHTVGLQQAAVYID